MSLGTLSNIDRIKVGALQEDICSLLCNAALLTAKDTCKAHRLRIVAYHKVPLREFALYSIQSYKRGALRGKIYHNLAGGNLCRIKSMQRLTHLHKHKVGNIYNIVYWAQSHSKQLCP